MVAVDRTRMAQAKERRATLPPTVCKTCLIEKPTLSFSPTGQSQTISKECNQCRRSRARRKFRAEHGRSTPHWREVWQAMKRRNKNGVMISATWFRDNIYCKPCVYCDHPAPSTADRIDNRVGYTETNIVSACVMCNVSRGYIFTSEEMFVIGPYLRGVLNAR